jgi:drug/metabolite transporter (DMT)-like permease
MVAASFLFSVMGVCVKLAAIELSNAMVVFFRTTLGLALISLWLFIGPTKISLRTRQLREHLIRGVVGVAAMYCFFYGIAHLGLAEALLLNYSLPLFVPLIERAWLKEPIPRGIWRALLIGFAGLALILQPGLGMLRPAALVGLLGALLGASAQVGVRGLTRTEPVLRIVFYFSLISTLIAAPGAALGWKAPSSALFLVLLILGVSAAIAQLFMTRAYGSAPAAQVGPFIYTSVVFAGFFDWLVFERLPGALSLGGAALVATAGIVALRSGRALRIASPPEAA